MLCIEKPLTFLSNGLELSAYIHTPTSTPSSIVLMLHGFTGNKIEANRLFVDIARALCSVGLAAFRFDYRCHGESPLPFEEFKLDYAIEDAENALNFIEATYRPRRVGVVGLSMGGHIAIKIASKYQSRISTISLLAPAVDIGKLAEAARSTVPKIDGYYVFGPHRLKEEGVVSIVRSNAMELAESIAIPVLIIHAKNDSVVPYKQSEEFYTRLKSLEKKLVPLDEGEHVFITYTSRAKVLSEVVNWLRDKLAA
ncbi:MAG: alpha/beta fold hydrolase [Ignisphaera sp.]|nr:lysophospholipase [Ignisphaera sp.]MDW8084852.1 alpha/beta fold hydrolase [Ignisphaera sp.]